MVSVFNSVQLKGLGFESWSSFSRPPSTFAHGWWVGQEFLLRWQQYQSNQWHQRRRSGTFFGASTVPLDQTLVFVKCHLLCFFWVLEEVQVVSWKFFWLFGFEGILVRWLRPFVPPFAPKLWNSPKVAVSKSTDFRGLNLGASRCQSKNLFDFFFSGSVFCLRTVKIVYTVHYEVPRNLVMVWN